MDHVYTYGAGLLHDTAGNTVYTPGVSQRQNGVDRYFHADWIGSTRYLTDASGVNAPTAYRFDSFGNTSAQAGPDSTSLKFAGAHGYQSDVAMGLMLLGARYYDPAVGRFLNPDPIGYAGGLNLYEYCEGNPVGLVDPTGLDAGWARSPYPNDPYGFKASKGPARQKQAFIFVGDLSTSNPVSDTAVHVSVWRDIAQLNERFSKAGYKVTLRWGASISTVKQDLKGAHAAAFIGHNAHDGAFKTVGPDDSEEFLDAFLAREILAGRRLDWAVLHVCFSDDPALRDALVGRSGRWEATKGFWVPVLMIDTGTAGWAKGKWRPKWIRKWDRKKR